ncbi:MAG: MTAP family purine nucleoside phosphorylase [Sphaerochaetaceae bacterium]
MKAIIGGTGLDKMVNFNCHEETIHTPYGDAFVSIGHGQDVGLVFLPRHGGTHSIPPHLINYRANIAALKQLGVVDIVAIYAVGSITDCIAPGEVSLVSDFIDFVSASRESTFYTGEEGEVRHVMMNHPFDTILANALLSVDKTIKDGGVYATTSGPRLETCSEIRTLKAMGADFVGMTLGTEVTLCNEKGIHIAALAYSINWAAGIKDDGMGFLGDSEANELAIGLARIAKRVLI